MDSLPYDVDTLFENPLVELTQSAMGTFGCRQKYVFRYLMWLVPRGAIHYFVAGKAMHRSMEIMLDPKNQHMSAEERLMWAEREIDAIFDQAMLDALVLNTDKFNKARAQSHACVKAWTFHWIDNLPFTMIEPEAKVRAKEGATTSSPLIDRMAGMLDGRVKDNIGEPVECLLESKSRYTLTGFDPYGSLPLNLQLLWYVKLAMERWNTEVTKVYYNLLGKPQHRTGSYEELTAKMTNAMVQDPDKYLAIPDILIDLDVVNRQYKNWERVVDHIDNLKPKDVTLNLNMCDDFDGCHYRPLCLACVDAGCPRSVFDCDQIAMYAFKEPHSELSEEE